MSPRVLLLTLAAGCLWGQDAPTRVGRLNYVYGSVSFRPDGIEEWAPAALNYPLSNGDHVWTDRDGHAEVHVGSTAVHLAPRTALFIILLDDRVFRMGLAEGALNEWIPRMNEGEIVEVDTPHGVFRLLRTGTYRLDALPHDDFSCITVRSGAAEVVADERTFAVAAGERLVLSGKPVRADLVEAVPPDAWDEWCANRDELAERGFEASQQYISWEVGGAEDLAQYGDWESDAEWGACWRPRGLPRRLGAVPLRALDLQAAVGLDVGGRGAVGLRALALRPLDTREGHVGVGPRRAAP